MPMQQLKQIDPNGQLIDHLVNLNGTGEPDEAAVMRHKTET